MIHIFQKRSSTDSNMNRVERQSVGSNSGVSLSTSKAQADANNNASLMVGSKLDQVWSNIGKCW